MAWVPMNEAAKRLGCSPQTEATTVLVLLHYQADVHERELVRLHEHHRQLLAAKDELLDARDDLIGELRVERDTLQIQIEKLREQLARAQQRPGWRFWD
jgi:hypothetical protein